MTAATAFPLINPASRHDPAYRWFAEARLGLFIHFSLATMFGEDLGYQYQRRVPYREYEANVAGFNPHRFSADAWVDAAEAGGCRYITLTAKHVEGFCLWDTRTTDFRITHTPFGRDLLGELAEACHRRAMPLCVYLNPDDWHGRVKPNMPGNWGDRNWTRDDDAPDWEAHVRYIEQQLTEVLTGYGPIAGIWFDCTHLPEEQIQGRRLYALIKRLQPACLVNDRAKYGDFLTPEWQIAEDLDAEQYLIEQCISIVENGWGWRREQRHRSAPACIDLLVRTAGCGSNLLLNVGPDPEGVIPAPQLERLRMLGDWLRRNGDAVYGTSGVRLAGLPDDLRVTRRGRDVYVFLRQYPPVEHVTVPGVHTAPASARLLGGGEDLAVSATAAGARIDGLPAMPPDATAQVVHLTFDTDPVLEPPAMPPRVETVIPVGPVGRVLLPVTAARMAGLAVKGWPLAVSELSLGDAAYAQPVFELPTNADQPYEDGPGVAPRLHAILNWRHAEHAAVWQVEVAHPTRVRVRVCLRCPMLAAGSQYELRIADRVLTATVQGNGPREEVLHADWWRGLHDRPFVWEDAGEIDLPAGRHTVTMQPSRLTCGTVFADVMAIALAPTG